MGETILIADSGGTKTDWCLVKDDQRIFFETRSCHPVNWKENFWEKLSGELSEYADLASAELYFFGAGCLNVENKNLATTQFQAMNFRKVTVKSDLHGAGYALFGKESGAGIISGTGSVLFFWENEEIVHRVGGKGHLGGDEGSGYYFGKLLKDKWEANDLTVEQKRLLHPTGLQVLNSLNANNEKFSLASLSKVLADHFSAFSNVHEENILSFVSSHFIDQKPDKVSILGGYGFANQALWQSILNRNHIELTVAVEKPIVPLVEQMDVLKRVN